MKIRLITLLLFQSVVFTAQVSNKVKELAKPLDTISYAESSHIGIGGEKSKIYNHFKNLSKAANNNELYYFAKNGSNALKLYSSQELFKRDDKRFLEIYKFYSENPVVMKYTMGCVGERESITYYLKNEMLAAKEIISLRDSLLQQKEDKLIKIQLKQIEALGYNKLSQENIDLYLKEIQKINSEKKR